MLSRLFAVVVLLGVIFSAACAAKADNAWSVYRERFISPEGRVVDTGNNGVSHSEGQGWGMMLAVHHGDQETFDLLWGWTRRHLARPDVSLFSWRYDPNAQPAVSDLNNATDGDLFIAWALYLAAGRWDNANYASASRSIRRAILKNLTRDVAGYHILLPGLTGFDKGGSAVVNLSYWFVPALNDFAQEEPDKAWQQLIDDGAKLLDQARFSQYLLPVDWLNIGRQGQLKPADGWPPRFSFDAVRIPLYFVWAGLDDVSGVGSISAFWNDPAHQPASAWMDVTTGERAEYPISRGVDAIRLLARGEALPHKAAVDQDDYYSATLLMLAHMADEMTQ